MYRAIPSRRATGLPFRGLVGMPALGTLYSVYSLPTYSCVTATALSRSRQACTSASSRRDGFVAEKGLHRTKKGSSARPYQIVPGDITFGPYSVFDPCAVKRLVTCVTKPPLPPPPPPPPAPPAPPSVTVTPTESTPVDVETPEIVEPEVVEVVEEEDEPESSNLYVVGGIAAALVVGGGLAYYLLKRKKKRR